MKGRLASLPRLLRLTWRRQLNVQVVATLLAASLLLGLFASWVTYRIELEDHHAQLRREGRTLAQAVAQTLPDEVLTGDTGTLEEYLDDIVASRQVEYARVERSSDGAELARSPRWVPVGAAQALEIVAPILIERGGERLGSLVVGMSLAPMQAMLASRFLVLIVQTTLTCVLVTVVLLLVLRTLVIVPLRRLDAEAARLARGELDTPLPDFGISELGRLALTMEEMRGNLQASSRSLALQNDRLRELDRLKSQFLANMSHEIRTPLNSILGSIELLQDDVHDEEERGRYFDTLRWNGSHLLDLVNTLLDFSKIESGNLIVDLVRSSPAAILDDVLSCMRPLADQKRLWLSAQIGDVPQWITTDPLRLRQILINVVGNAIKFTEQGGIDIGMRLVDPGPDQRLEIRVVDTGIGMSEEFLTRIFQPFSQSDGSMTRRFGGTGLGLSIARKLANHLGGDIAVTSEVGAGTCMTVTVAAPTAVAAEVVATTANAANQRLSGRVLLVDDMLDNQRLMSVLLRKAGVDVEVADNGRAAIDRIEDASVAGRSFDLVLMDLQMPVMDGLTAVRWLREHEVATPIVALTAHALAEDRARCMAAGCDGYETKPISRARLLQVLAEFLPRAADPTDA